jgi:hypothetical protein
VKTIVLIITILGLLAITGMALAEEIAVEIESSVNITSPDSQTTRFLLLPELTFPDTTQTIDWARLELWVEPLTEDTLTYISIRAYPINAEWDSDNVSWGFPWVNPGGDVNDEFYAEFAIGTPGSQNIAIDMTDLCLRWNNGSTPYFGILIDVSKSSLAPVRFQNGPNGNGPFATLRINYTSFLSEP